MTKPSCGLYLRWDNYTLTRRGSGQYNITGQYKKCDALVAGHRTLPGRNSRMVSTGGCTAEFLPWYLAGIYRY